MGSGYALVCADLLWRLRDDPQFAEQIKIERSVRFANGSRLIRFTSPKLKEGFHDLLDITIDGDRVCFSRDV